MISILINLFWLFIFVLLIFIIGVLVTLGVKEFLLLRQSIKDYQETKKIQQAVEEIGYIESHKDELKSSTKIKDRKRLAEYHRKYYVFL